jgi:hypothetical protein
MVICDLGPSLRIDGGSLEQEHRKAVDWAQGCAPEKTEFAERTSLHLAGVDYPTKASAKGGRDARQ